MCIGLAAHRRPVLVISSSLVMTIVVVVVVVCVDIGACGAAFALVRIECAFTIRSVDGWLTYQYLFV